MVFSHTDFRAVIEEKIAENRQTRGYRSRLAEAAGCQRSFLSHVLNSSVLLTPDHALGLCRFWELSEDETEYFLTLVALSRAQTAAAHAYYRARLEAQKQKREDLARLLDRRREKLSAEKEAAYYNSWIASAVHIATSVPGLRSATAIARRLRLTTERVESVLALLREMGLVDKTAQGWRIGRQHLHLARSSPLMAVHHANWRQKVIARLQEGDLSGVHYSVVYGLSRADLERVRQLVLELIEKTKQVVEPSPEEELACFLCDFFML